MKRSTHVLAVFAIHLLMISAAVANEDYDLRVLKYPALTDVELKQVPFKASLPERDSPNGAYVSLHNPFRDKIVAGIVLEISYKKPSSDKPTVLELYLQMNCGPLQSAGNQLSFFEADEARKAGATITLKEVHYLPPEPAKTE